MRRSSQPTLTPPSALTQPWRPGGLLAWRRRLLLAVAVWLALGSPAAGQVRAALVGRVTDPQSEPVPGAVVTLTDVATQLGQMAVTDATGTYGFVGLQPGVYRLVAELAGFRRMVREGLQLHSGARLRVDVELEIGGLSESVVVTRRAPRLQTESATLGQVVSRARVEALPLNGRNFIDLTVLAPGVARPPTSAFPRINGGRPRTNEYIFDGISVLQPEPGQVPFLPIVEEIAEFRVESNSPPAEFGRFNGGVVHLTTRAGSNQLGGTSFGFFRHEALNARNAFAPQGPGEPNPRFRRQQYGGVIGGPLRPQPHVLLPGVSGVAPGCRPRAHLDGADGAPAAGRVHRAGRRRRAGHLRPRDDRGPGRGRLLPPALCGQHDSGRPDGSDRARPAPALPPPEPWPGRRTTISGSGSSTSRRSSSACGSTIGSRPRRAASCALCRRPTGCCR